MYRFLHTAWRYDVLTLFAIVAIFALSACSGSVPWNPQGYAGITHVDAEWKDDSPDLKRVRVWQGKEGESFDITANLKEGTVTWAGKSVRAFEAFKTRADVEKYGAENASDAVKAVAPDVVNLIAKAVGL